VNSFNIEQILTFPIKETESRKNFLIGVLVNFAGFIIPILPMILVMGYIARVMRQVFRGEQPRMPAWDDWGAMLKDGAYIYGVRIVYMLPVFVILVPLFLGGMVLPIWLDSNGSSNELIALLPILFFILMVVIIFPFSLTLGILLPAAEAHTIANNEFAAGFRIREWWQIFWANIGGFIIAYLISIGTGYVLSIILQIAMITIILICVLPLIMPAIMMYTTLITYTAFAQAYGDGKTKISQ
jgi:hypothetical protein